MFFGGNTDNAMTGRIYQATLRSVESCACVVCPPNTTMIMGRSHHSVRCGCDDSYCYTQGECVLSTPSRKVVGETWRTCQTPPAPPPHPHACDDPMFPLQWHLTRIRATEAWSMAAAHHHDVRVVVVDDGVRYDHPDLNVSVEHSFGWNDEHEYTTSSATTHTNHGTWCAGVAMSVRSNALGGCGVALRGTLVGVRLLTSNGMYTEQALVDTLRMLTPWEQAVVTNSWGPPPRGGPQGPGHTSSLAAVDAALHDFGRRGRNGRGGVVVFASGNGGEYDNVNDDGYAAHARTIAVSSVGYNDRRSTYAEPGACLDLVAPSSIRSQQPEGVPAIMTTGSAASYVHTFGGTSAAAPIVAGVVSLLLQTRPALRGADVRRVLVRTARRVDPDDPSWTRNAAGRWFSHWYGFGLVDAAEAVSLAQHWNVSDDDAVEACAPAWTGSVTLSSTSERVRLPTVLHMHVERVRVRVGVYDCTRCGGVQLRLVSPSGTVSRLTFDVPSSVSSGAFGSRWFSTNAFDGERSYGTWSLDAHAVYDAGRLNDVWMCVEGYPLRTNTESRTVSGRVWHMVWVCGSLGLLVVSGFVYALTRTPSVYGASPHLRPL
jgi:hypothetical protein